MKEGEGRPSNTRGQLQGLPVVRTHVAGTDLGSEHHWTCAPTVDGNGREVADFGAQHKFYEAEPLFANALGMLKHALGSKHPEIVPALRDLAKTYREQARFSETKRLLEVSIAILEKAAGPNYCDTEVALEFYSEILRVMNLDAERRS